MTDPTETWRATFAIDGRSASAQLRETQTDFEDTLDDLKATQKALAASQADLTAMQARYEEASAEAKVWRAEAERYLGTLQEVATDLCATKYQNRRLQAELDSALGALNEKEET